MTEQTTYNPALTNPPLTAELLTRILAGATTVEPQIAAALRRADLTGSFECPYCHGHNDGSARIKSCGMGVESIGMLLEWLFTPASRDFCLCQLIIITAQTGDEHEDTKGLMETFILPLYRYFRLRFVELARRGELEEDGICILQDTREATELHIEGFYRLSEHLQLAGTVPQFGGEHRCSLKFKAFVIEYWLTHCFSVHGFYHVFGYSADEQGRADKCDLSIERRNEQVQIAFGYNVDEQSRADKSDAACARRNVEVHVAFGFNADEQERADRATENDEKPRLMAFGYNADEQGRAERTTSHDTLTRIGFYPLIVWGWTREFTLQSIFDRLGVIWEKSACLFCPFNSEASKQTAKGIGRLMKHPAQTAHALLVEYGSLCLNERGALYNTQTLQQIVFTSAQAEALNIFERMLEQIEFGLYEVKRIYTAKGTAARSVMQLAKGSRQEMSRLFSEQAERIALDVRTARGINYAMFAKATYTEERIVAGKGRRTRRIKPEMVFPSVEGFLVVAPARISQKVRGKFEVFEERFSKAASERGIVLPLTPGTAQIRSRQPQCGLFEPELKAA